MLMPKKGGWFGAPIEMGWGVRQGDIVSPTLLNIIVDATLHLYKQHMMDQGGGQVAPDVCFYADDRCIAGTDTEAVQQALDHIIFGFTQMGMVVNRRKTKWMYTTGTMWVNCLQHGAYCNPITGGSDMYMD